MLQRLERYFLLVAVGALAAQASWAGPGACPFRALDVTLPTGSRWEMCWQSLPAEGVAFQDVYYTTPGGLERKVLAEASLAQLHEALADGSVSTQLIAEVGLGRRTRSLRPGDCPGGTIHANLLCAQTDARGYVYKHFGAQKQGYALRLFSIASIGERSYILQWRFYDDGSIEPSVGSAGRLERYGTDSRYGWPIDASGTIAVASMHTYTWRLHFDIAGNGANEIVEELEFPPNGTGTRRITSIAPLSTEAGRSADPENMRSWRVRDASVANSDGHAVSYHLDPTGFRSRYLGSAGDVAGFVSGEDVHTADVVIWYGVSGQRLPRDEDEPNLGVRWDGFVLIPRDWTAQSPL
jgi:primary-amine oxidase